VQPAIEKNIPVRILNSRRPEVCGTLIVAETVHCRNPIKSIACKRDITVVEIRSLRMLMAHGFLRRIFEVFDRYQTPVDLVTTSEVCVAVTIDQPRYIGEIERELARIADVNVIPGQAIICLVGDALRETPGLGARIFTALRQINVRMISEGASFNNVSLVVRDEDLVPAVAALHEEFFREVDPEVCE
jgi:aspartate kinase